MNQLEFKQNHFQQDCEVKLKRLETRSFKEVKELGDRIDTQAKLLQFTNIMKPETDREKFEAKISQMVVN